MNEFNHRTADRSRGWFDFDSSFLCVFLNFLHQLSRIETLTFRIEAPDNRCRQVKVLIKIRNKMKCFQFALILLFVVCVQFSSTNEVRHSLTEKFAWKNIEYIWPDDATKEDAIINGLYKSENNLPLGLDVWGDKLFITVPRYLIEFN